MSAPHLTRPLVLEAVQRVADGLGGFGESWVALGTLWAAVVAGSGRDVAGQEVTLAAVPYRITVRAAAQGAASRPAPGAIELVRTLSERGCQLGILTRNAYELALLTLQAIGLHDCFAPAHVLGRDEAAPKPAPDGLLHLADAWQVAPHELVMVGDYRFDLECARAAGACSVLVNLLDNPWPELADHFAVDCTALRRAL